MRPVLLIAGLLLLLAGPVNAQGLARAQALRAMLDMMPAAFLEVDDALVWFGDVAAASGLDFEAPDEDGMLAVLRGLPSTRYGEALFSPPEAWRDRIGIVPDEIAQSLHLDAPPIQVTLLRLTGPDPAEALHAALLAQGYEPRGAGQQAPLGRGGDDAINLFERAPEDIFRGALGRSARVQVDGTLVRHATTWPLFDALADASGPGAAGHPPLAALLDALDAVRMNEAGLVQALILPDTTALAIGDPARSDAQSVLRGGPLLLADLSTGRREVAVMAFPLPGADIAQAAALADRIAGAWSGREVPRMGQTFAMLAGAPAQVSAYLSKSGPVIVLSVETATAERFGVPENPGYRLIAEALMRRELVFLEN